MTAPITAHPRLLTGWGRTAPTLGYVATPSSLDELASSVADVDGRGLIARGLGRSYGDAAQNAGGRVVSMTSLAGVRELDLEAGLVTVDAGVTIDQLTRFLVTRGRFLPVVPGTGRVTVGGAIASDIHGKNHHADGGLGEHVTELELLTAGGERIVARPGDAAFRSTVGGMGLTGILLSATLRLLAVETSRMRVDTERARDLDDLMGRMESGDSGYRYSVAWIDCLARGAGLGRSVLMRGDHAFPEDLSPTERADPLSEPDWRSVPAPPWAPSGLLRPATMRAFNEVWFRKAPLERRRTLEGIREFFHPLDAIDGWNRLYGARGMLQYQFVVPFGAEDTVRTVLERLSSSGVGSFLAVFKRLGSASAGLSFPLRGWTLALDMPAGGGELAALLDDLDERVASAGGRVYLAKDSRVRPELIGPMYPALGEWREDRARLDPEGAMRSDLSRRLDLV